MSSIKDAIVRVGRSFRQIEAHSNRKPVAIAQRKSKVADVPAIHQKSHRNFSHREIEEFKPFLDNYQRKIYQDFLSPLNIPDLKIFNNKPPKYNIEEASKNWKKKKSNDSIVIFNEFLQNRVHFNRMVNFLVEITPEQLKLEENNNTNILSKILAQEELQENENKFPHLAPKYVFQEIPPIPQPLTQKSFQEYIYMLTHSSFYYKNSSSLKSGIIADILLYTHKLTNEEFKPFRSVHTYNYLIRYFGYSKNQSSFARELLLVMNKDGHKPNIDTINNLLKLCQTHSNIRSVSNTYQIILKYLKLCSSLSLRINLTTYNRIYDSINNIFLKEIFLDKLNAINLPIQKNLVLRIIDDFMKTTKVSVDLINFVESEMKYANWQKDSKLLNKIVYHRCLHLKNNEEFVEFWQFLDDKSVDEYTLKYILEAINRNNNLSKKPELMLAVYANLSKLPIQLSSVPIIYKHLVLEFIESNCYLEKLAFVIRGLFHDAVSNLQLPMEITSYGVKSSDPENYKIFKRIIGLRLNHVEAKLAYVNSDVVRIKPLKVNLSPEELDAWNELKQSLSFDHINPLSLKLQLPNTFFTHTSPLQVPHSYIANYERNELRKVHNARSADRMQRLSQGNHSYIEQQLQERSIWNSFLKK